MKIYTRMDTPFAIGGTHIFIATEIDEKKQKQFIVGDYNFLIVKNPIHNLFHCIWSECGAIIGTDKKESELKDMTISDVSAAKKKDIKEQLEQGKIDCKNAQMISIEEFFNKFR